MQCAYRSGCTLPITKVPEANFYTCKAWQVVRAQQLRDLPFVDQRTVGAAQLVCMQGLRAAKMHCMNGHAYMHGKERRRSNTPVILVVHGPDAVQELNQCLWRPHVDICCGRR
jgi:hypothetical protein